jgi:hypothetical protein
MVYFFDLIVFLLFLEVDEVVQLSQIADVTAF